jgi:hypothetical protein
MQLFEFSVLIERHVVVLAEDETKARSWFGNMSADGLSFYGDPGDIIGVDLIDVRPGTTDDAHVEV